MAKLSRSYLKSIVKECLVEILEEGIGVPQGGVISERRSRKTAKASRKSESQSRRKGRRPLFLVITIVSLFAKLSIFRKCNFFSGVCRSHMESK